MAATLKLAPAPELQFPQSRAAKLTCPLLPCHAAVHVRSHQAPAPRKRAGFPNWFAEIHEPASHRANAHATETPWAASGAPRSPDRATSQFANQGSRTR